MIIHSDEHADLPAADGGVMRTHVFRPAVDGRYPGVVLYSEIYQVTDPIRRLAALVPPAAAEGVGARLKLSNAQRKRLIAATAGVGDEGPQALAYRHGVEGAVDRMLLAGDDPAPIVDWTPPRLPISGGALVARGLDRGPVVAAALKAVETRWIAEGFPDDQRVAAIADEIAAELACPRFSSSNAASDSSGRA